MADMGRNAPKTKGGQAWGSPQGSPSGSPTHEKRVGCPSSDEDSPRSAASGHAQVQPAESRSPAALPEWDDGDGSPRGMTAIRRLRSNRDLNPTAAQQPPPQQQPQQTPRSPTQDTPRTPAKETPRGCGAPPELPAAAKGRTRLEPLGSLARQPKGTDPRRRDPAPLSNPQGGGRQQQHKSKASLERGLGLGSSPSMAALPRGLLPQASPRDRAAGRVHGVGAGRDCAGSPRLGRTGPH